MWVAWGSRGLLNAWPQRKKGEKGEGKNEEMPLNIWPASFCRNTILHNVYILLIDNEVNVCHNGKGIIQGYASICHFFRRKTNENLMGNSI